MKKLVTFLFFVAVATNSVIASDGYTEAMQGNIRSLYAAQTVADLQMAVNSLDRISQVEKSKWEPIYYVTLGYILMATQESDAGKKDAYLDLAKSALDKASAIRKDDSELVTLEGFIYTMRVTVDPASRGPQFAGLAMQTFDRALTINPGNPRAMALLAQMQFGTAKFFKQTPTEGCASAAKALILFAEYKPESPLAPQWGRQSVEELVKNCK